MSTEMEKATLVEQIQDKVKNSNLPLDIQEWLISEKESLEQVVERYKKNPNFIEIPKEASEEVIKARTQLKENPILIIDTILSSAEILHQYQMLYKNSLNAIATASGVDSSEMPFEKLARAIEDATYKRERKRIEGFKKDGQKIAMPILGIGGTGKGTMIKLSGIPRIVNHTTRPRRPGEEEGVDYYYVGNVNLEGYKEDEKGNLVDYHANNYGPFVADLLRPGRGRYSTSVKSVEDGLKTSPVVFIEQSPEQVKVIGQKIPELMQKTQVVPVCILPPGSGILELATRVIVRTYGDPIHRDTDYTKGYKIKDSYLESTVGPGQIAEIAQTVDFSRGANPLGIAYIVNDDLNRSVALLKDLIK
jgi:guanylate kinase